MPIAVESAVFVPRVRKFAVGFFVHENFFEQSADDLASKSDRDNVDYALRERCEHPPRDKRHRGNTNKMGSTIVDSDLYGAIQDDAVTNPRYGLRCQVNEPGDLP